jgi:hypothetical protein
MFERGINSCSSYPDCLVLTLNPGYDDTRVLYEFPSHVLRSELQRRDEQVSKPACGSGGRRGSYNMALHVAALFIILILSTLGNHALSLCMSVLVPIRFTN